MEISKLDHLVLTVRDVEKTTFFYGSVLGMEKDVFGDGRIALKCRSQKINLHEAGKEFEPKAHKPTPGSADLCFITQTPLNDAMAHVERCGVEIIEGPVDRTGANGPIRSFYFRDPDDNLIEVANDKKVSPFSSNLPQIIRNFIIIYLIAAVTVLAICFVFGWRSLENIGTGFIYGSLGLSVFGALLLAGNTVPAQLSKLSLPSARRQEEYESDGSASKYEGRRFFFTTLICGAFLFVTGLILKIL